jgi:catechol 2,3-dioxygenase-like lactoylglutathione lyase family enzyme
MFYALPMRLGAVIVYVADVGASVDFYERAFGLERGGVSTEDYSELTAGSETLLSFAAQSFIDSQLPGHAQPPAGFEIVLVADDVQAAFDRAVAAGAEPVSEPAEKPWGQVVSYVRDPDGTLVEICTAWG